MSEIENLVATVFRGDWDAYRRSLPERATVENGDGTWYTMACTRK